MQEAQTATQIDIETFKETVKNDFYLACLSREASLLGRKEVLTGKAKFGIFGDGKELAQLAMAHAAQPGDWRSGYYRDQTFMMAVGALTVQQFFAALYAHTDPTAEPASAGRQMGGHFATHTVTPDGEWVDLMAQVNSSADISPTAGQMPRLVGLAQASKVYRENKLLKNHTRFSDGGREVAFGTIGDASTSEGLFWEAINAAGVLQVPVVMSVWDDGFGISVPRKYQTTKDNISEALKGFQRTDESPGYELFKVRGWDYPALVKTYEKAVNLAREEQIPVLIHVTEVTQPQGHSTSGSHERYKTKEQLEWTKEFDCLVQFRKWIESRGDIATSAELDELAEKARKTCRTAQKEAWQAYLNPIISLRDEICRLVEQMAEPEMAPAIQSLKAEGVPTHKDILHLLRKAIRHSSSPEAQQTLKQEKQRLLNEIQPRYSAHLYSEGNDALAHVKAQTPEYNEDAPLVDGRVVLRDNWKEQMNRRPELMIFGEDVGFIGGVNQSTEGLQQEFGNLRVSDTGIREATIVGQGIGLAMRGLRPVAEIQYLDYLLYALQLLSDDLATVRYRTFGRQKAPLIISTRGHRLEGIWHSGSPMGGIIHLVRGMYVCVPRNMTQAAGMYNALLECGEPAIVVEPLNGYRTKEKLPLNLADFKVIPGQSERLRDGDNLTLVSYGSTLNLCLQAAEELNKLGVECDVIDVQSLLPFDDNRLCAESLKKTNRLLIVDEDVPGGASAYILNQILQHQEGFFQLDREPVCLTAKAHRPAYGTDGDYFSKPSLDDICEAALALARG